MDSGWTWLNVWPGMLAPVKFAAIEKSYRHDFLGSYMRKFEMPVTRRSDRDDAGIRNFKVK